MEDRSLTENETICLANPGIGKLAGDSSISVAFILSTAPVILNCLILTAEGQEDIVGTPVYIAAYNSILLVRQLIRECAQSSDPTLLQRIVTPFPFNFIKKTLSLLIWEDNSWSIM